MLKDKKVRTARYDAVELDALDSKNEKGKERVKKKIIPVGKKRPFISGWWKRGFFFLTFF